MTMDDPQDDIDIRCECGGDPECKLCDGTGERTVNAYDLHDNRDMEAAIDRVAFGDD